MRMNLPVNDQEYVLPDDALIVTKTDLKGLITYVNQDFIDACGFSREELIGAPHNLIRHPDVPPAAFADLWQTLKAGRPWSGIVKNRRKDGGYYWVVANVAPITEAGRAVGYVSARTRPSREQIDAATSLYALLRDGKAPQLALHDGQIELRGLRGLPQRIKRRWSIRGKFSLLALLLIVPLLVMFAHWFGGITQDLEAARADREGLAEHRQQRALLEAFQNQSLGFGQGGSPSVGGATTLPSSAANLQTLWQDAQGRGRDRPTEAIAAFNQLTRETVKLMASTARQSGLILESGKDEHHLARLLAQELPQLANVLGETQVWASLLGTRPGETPPDLRRELLGLSGTARAHLHDIAQAIALMGETDPALTQRLGTGPLALAQTSQRFLALTDQGLFGPKPSALRILDFQRETQKTLGATYAFYDTLADHLDAALTARGARLGRERSAVGGLILALTLAGFGLGAVWVLSFVRALGDAAGQLKRLAEGDFHSELTKPRHDEVGAMLDALRTMQMRAGFKLSQTRRNAATTARAAMGLTRVSTMVMLANARGKIVFVNDSLHEHFARHAEAIRRDFPDFAPEQLLQADIDRFHKNPAHQRQLLAELRSPHHARIQLGGRDFELTVTPIRDAADVLTGYAVEWLDRSEELAVEREVAALLAAAAQGDFSVRLALENKQGFFRELALSVNRLLELSQSGLAEIARVIGAIARGDLTEQITGDYAGTLATLKDDTNRSIAQLREIVAKIRDSAEVIHTAAREIAAGNADLSARTEAQAASLEETAASMEELTATVKQNADNARQANTLAHEAAEVATRGGEAVGEVVQTMQGIHAAAKRIADIIGVIDGIAFQTNILALNAAVEAARAGEQGRGFAVVAAEVRNLAQRVAAAAKEVKGLIGDSSSRIEAGASQVQAAGKTMNEILLSAHQVSALVADISSASAEQYSGIEQINQAIAQMDQTTQQNAALVEQATAGAEELNAQAEGLAEVVEQFRLHELAPVVGRASRPARSGLASSSRT